MSMNGKVLVLGDEPASAELLRGFLKSEGFEVVVSCDKAEGLRRLFARNFDILLVDQKMTVSAEMEFFRLTRLVDPDVSVIMTTTEGNISSAVNAVKEGLCDYLQHTSDPGVLLQAVKSAKIDSSSAARIDRRDGAFMFILHGIGRVVAIIAYVECQ
jgi:DNA-binding NtrC family response regulator